MIRSIEIKNLRALRYVDLELRPFQIVVGPNGSGKSTFLDAINMVRDILNVGVDRTLQGDRISGVPIRAIDPRDISWMRSGEDVEIALTSDVPEDVQKGYRFCRYEIALSTTGEPRLRTENFWLCRDLPRPSKRYGKQVELFPAAPSPPESVVRAAGRKSPPGWRKVVSKIAESGNDYFKSEVSDWNNLFRLGPAKSTLANLPEDEEKFPTATWFKRFLMEGVQRLALNAEKIRLACPPGTPATLMTDGSNLPRIVHLLETRAPDVLREWTEHLRTALPGLASVRTVERPEDRFRYLVLRYDNGLEAPSWVVSDGTLRILALTLLAYAPVAPGLLLIEEPENGIHPQAVETVFQSLSDMRESQVFCATHSPVMLSLSTLDQLLCFGTTPDGAVDVVPGDKHPMLRDWQGAVVLGDLFATGVLS